MRKCIENLNDYAVSGQTSIYGEDSITAKALIMKCARKMRECVKVLMGVEQSVTGTTLSTYQPMFYPLYHEDSKSLIELAGDIYKANNDCITFIEELIVKVIELDSSKEEQLTELRNTLNTAYVDVYDDCAMNILELAGLTGAIVNDCVENVNNFYNIVAGVKAPEDEEGGYEYDENEETLIVATNYVEDDEEVLL